MTLSQIQGLEKVPIRYTTPETSELHEPVNPGDNQIDLAVHAVEYIIQAADQAIKGWFSDV